MTRPAPHAHEGRRRLRAPAVGLLAVFLLSTGTGCFTVYQPLVGLQRPTAVNPTLPNFQGQKVLVRCIPPSVLETGDSDLLCRNVRSLFTNQGAEVEVEVPRAGGLSAGEDAQPKVDFTVELTSRVVHYENSTLLLLLCLASLTLIPSIEDTTYALDVAIRDPNGFLLVQDTMQGRFVHYTGAGVWAINGVMDVLVRKPEDKLTTDQSSRDFSRDYHAQLSQLLFHARMRALVQRNFEPEPATAPAAPRTR